MTKVAISLLDKHRLMIRATRHPAITVSALAALSVIVERYNAAEGCARPGLTRMGKDTGMTKLSMLRGVQLLEKLGLIEIERRGRRANRYKINPQTEVCIDQTGISSDTRLVSAQIPKLVSAVIPESTEGIHYRIPDSGWTGAGAAALAADAADAAAAAPAPDPRLNEAWQLLKKRGGRALNLAEISSECQVRLAKGESPASISSCIKQLATKSHWVELPKGQRNGNGEAKNKKKTGKARGEFNAMESESFASNESFTSVNYEVPYEATYRSR